MASIDELTNAESQLNPDLAALRVLSFNQQIVFTQYVRRVLPLDGMVFWLRAGNMTVTGSLHHASDLRQVEDETAAYNHIIFTTDKEVADFGKPRPDTMWIGTFNGLRFAFAQHTNFYQAVGLWHYIGDAVNPALLTQLIEVGQQLLDTTLIVSNSLPAWLALVDYTPQWLAPLNPRVTLYPSFLVPANLAPPYGVVHIDPTATTGLQLTPSTNRLSSHFQLSQDRARITLYGLTNDQCLDFHDLVNQFSMDTDLLGMMGPIPVMRDEKRTQVELGVIAMKKTIEFTVSYIQVRINDLARQLITSALVTFFPTEITAPL